MISSLLVLASRLNHQEKIKIRQQNQDGKWLSCLCFGQVKGWSQCFKQKRSINGERRTSEKPRQSSGKHSRPENSWFLSQTLWDRFAEQLWKWKSAKVGLTSHFLMEILEVLLALQIFQPTSALFSQETVISTLLWSGFSLVALTQDPKHLMCNDWHRDWKQTDSVSSVLGISSWKAVASAVWLLHGKL